ncbi:MAG TPA: SRPBCC domain-containing protein [Micromonosporaceae bacterium]|nr:SRPBCC domain-containing protein [Micromonosporaceae bacterium]
MSKQLRTEIDIQAGPERVWQVLTDFAAYPQWNPFLVRASGSLVPGGRLTVRMQPAGGRAMTFRPTVREAAPPRRLRWLGHLLLPGIFDGEHSFTIEQLDAGRVRLVQEEEFRGVLVPLLSRFLDRRTRPAFEQMNQALKRRAEQAGP